MPPPEMFDERAEALLGHGSAESPWSARSLSAWCEPCRRFPLRPKKGPKSLGPLKVPISCALPTLLVGGEPLLSNHRAE